MTDKDGLCPYCGADRRGTSKTGGEDGVWFACGTYIHGYRGSLCSTREETKDALERCLAPSPWRRLLVWLMRPRWFLWQVILLALAVAAFFAACAGDGVFSQVSTMFSLIMFWVFLATS